MLKNKNIEKIFHYASFDLAALENYFGIVKGPVWCTKIASKLARTYSDRNGLSDLCKELLEIELREEKSDAQRRMAWVAMSAMVLFSIALYTPLVPIPRVNALADLLGGFYIAQAGVVAAYMGVSAWMGKK